jgi:hypothetical protein
MHRSHFSPLKRDPSGSRFFSAHGLCPKNKKSVTFFDVIRLCFKTRARVPGKKRVKRGRTRFQETKANCSRSPEMIFREGGEIMSTKIFYLVFPLMLLGLMIAPALAAIPDYVNFENALALSSQSRSFAGCPRAADMLRDPFILARGGGGNGGGGGGGAGAGAIGGGGGAGGSGACLGGSSGTGSGPQGDHGSGDNRGQGLLGDDTAQHQHQNQNKHQHRHHYGESSQNQAHYGPGDGTGNDGDGPQDGTGYSAGANK